MSHPIHIVTDDDSDIESKRILLEGDLDAVLASQLEKVLNSGDMLPARKIIIDLKKVPVVMPDGVRVLLNASILFDDGILVVENPNETVRQLLKTVGLEALIG